MMMHAGVDLPENIAVLDDGVWSNRDLLNQLRAVAVGIRDFVALGTRLELTQLVVEVKDELLLINGAKNFTSDSSTTKLKAREITSSLEKRLAAPSRAPPAKTSKVDGVVPVNSPLEGSSPGERDDLIFSDAYLAKKFNLSKFPGSSSGKRSKTSRQSSPCSTGGIAKLPARKELDKTALKLKTAIRVSGKTTVKQMLRALALEKRVLPEPAVADVVAVKKQHEAARTEMTELLDEIRGMEYDNYNDLPPDITASWVAAHAKQLRSSCDLQCTVLRHALGSTVTSSKEVL